MSGNVSEETTLKYKYLTSIFSKAFDENRAHQLAGAVLPLANEDQLVEYMTTLLDFSKVEHQRLFQDVKFIKFGYKREEASEEEQELIRQIIEDKEREIHFRLGGWDEGKVAATADLEEKRKKSKKGTKLNLTELHKGYLKQGRVPCECQATEHKLINNCIECGRIVCEQEGSGPCFFCDSMVCTPEEQEILSSSSKQGSQLYNTLMERKKSEDWKKMIEQRDRLISYDEQFSSRTKIIDEDDDYYDENNKWLSDKQRKKIKEHNEKEKERQEKSESRLNKSLKITLDVKNIRAIEEQEENFVFRSLTAEDLEESDNEDNISGEKLPKMPDITDLVASMKQKCEASPGGVQKAPRKIKKSKTKNLSKKDLENIDVSKLDPSDPDDYIIIKRLEQLEIANDGDESMEEISTDDDEFAPDEMPTILDPMYTSGLDFGQCLSMHQPWASLLVYGIKRHEGRGWETDHRGRLWIASTGKPPEKQDIDECEKFYRRYYEDTTVVFPKVYPTGVLLGSVFVQDCVDKEDYEKYYDKRELDGSPYVFICENPQILPFPLPIKGKPKIYTLDLDIHKTARKALGLKKK